MISPIQAKKLIAANLRKIKNQKINTNTSIGYTLNETIYAERDQPPFDRVTMDGIAVNSRAFKNNNYEFNIESVHFAGDSKKTLKNKYCCIEVMTGSVLPEGTDCVIPIERLTIKNNIACLEANYELKKWQFIHRQGSDHKKGEKVLQPGHKIAPIDIALILSCGKDKINVNGEPSIRVISTGSELIPAGKKIQPHQIRMSNGPSIVAMLNEQNYKNCMHHHLVDDKQVQKMNIKKYLSQSNILILSGGISMGKADFIPKILDELKVECIFYKIKQRPGKPMWFGVGPKNQLVFALPGNPVSAITCCRHYIIPALKEMCGGENPDKEYVQLQKNIHLKSKLTYFLPVKFFKTSSAIRKVIPIETNTSGDFTSLSGTSGYIELSGNKNKFSKSENIIFHNWKHP